MQDRIEQFIKENRDAFDVHEPRAGLWGGVYELMHKRQKNRRIVYVSAAASLLLAVCVIALLIERRQTLQVREPEANVGLSPEMQEAEFYYTGIVQVKRGELNKYCRDYPELCNEFEKEVIELNILYTQLKEEYKNSNGREAVMKAMIDNLQTQVQMTGRQLQIIQSVKQKDNHTKPHV